MLAGTDTEPMRWACSPEHLASLWAGEGEIADPMPAAVIHGNVVPLSDDETDRFEVAVDAE
jgi:hypothetical protein